MMNVEIANRLYEYRKKSNLSQDELAEKIGVSRQAVSKWERAEASPDTDNLILLARLYEVSIDELINTDPPSSSSAEKKSEIDGDYVNISPKGIHVVEEDGSEVHVSWKGVHVKDVNEDKEVHVGWDGIRVRDGEEYYYDEEGWTGVGRHSLRREFPIVLLAIVAYVIIASLYNLWHPTWIILFIIPIYSSFVEVFHRKTWRGRLNAVPVMLCAIAFYLFYAFFYGSWHPMWIVLLIGPCYHSLVNYLFPKKKKMRQEKENNDKTDEKTD